MDVVAVGDVALVSDALDDAEAALQALGKFIGGGLQRRTVEGEIDIALLLPLQASFMYCITCRAKGVAEGSVWLLPVMYFTHS